MGFRVRSRRRERGLLIRRLFGLGWTRCLIALSRVQRLKVFSNSSKKLQNHKTRETKEKEKNQRKTTFLSRKLASKQNEKKKKDRPLNPAWVRSRQKASKKENRAPSLDTSSRRRSGCFDVARVGGCGSGRGDGVEEAVGFMKEAGQEH